MKSTLKNPWVFEPTAMHTLLLSVVLCGFVILEAYFPEIVSYLANHGFKYIEDLEFFPDKSYDFVFSYIEWAGVLYGFLMPLILVRAWEQFDKIDREFDREADTLKIMYEDISLFHKNNDKLKRAIYDLLFKYINHVIKHHADEAETNSPERDEGDECLRRVRKEYYELFHPSVKKNKEADALSSETLRQLDKLIDIRGDRISLSNQRLFESLRFVSLITSVIFALPFYFVKFHYQGAYGFLDSTLVFGVIFLIIFILTTIEDLDEPFIGSWKISMEPWRRIQKEIGKALTELEDD